MVARQRYGNRYRPVLVVLNNAGYRSIKGLLRAWGNRVAPEMSAGDCANYDIGSVGFSKLASVFGINAQRVTNPTDVRPASVLSEAARRRSNNGVQ
jgi:thiamine pyrophosphate-dependent acetolactate synthase large subunit-like protein